MITSGGDGVFPRGLSVGVIQSIAPDPEHQPYAAIYHPAAAAEVLRDWRRDS